MNGWKNTGCKNEREWRAMQAVLESRRREEEFAERHPILYALGQILGGVAFVACAIIWILALAVM